MLVVAAVGCESGGGQLPPGPVDVTYVDPDGVEWVGVDGVLERWSATGPSCAPATWYRVSEMGPDSPVDWAIVAIPDTGQAVLDFGGVTTQAGGLSGGLVTVLVDEPTELSVQFDDGCTGVAGDTQNLCTPQTGPAMITIDGPLEDWPLKTLDGVPGYATEATTGDAICGGELGGT
jgi:hypothetical protein